MPPFLILFKALDFRRWVGGEKIINDYCHDLAARGGQLLADLFETSVLDPSGELTLNMVSTLLTSLVEKTMFTYNFY